MLKYFRLVYFFFLFTFPFLHVKGGESNSPSYPLTTKVKKQVAPYLLPSDHPVKAKLDKIFSSSRVLLNLKTMKKAGFIHPEPRKFTKLIVTKHPDLKGYVIKTYVDAQRYYKDTPEYEFWILRIKGAEAIRSLIQTCHLEHQFKVPKKWIYFLPKEPAPPLEYYRKNFILIEEDMDIFDDEENEVKWKSSWVTTDLLDHLYFILTELGLYDCAQAPNIPFSLDGRIAFIDTQIFDEWPVDYKRLTPYLSSPMKTYWKQLINSSDESK